MNFLYFDIESLENIFSCVVHDEHANTLDIYHLIDPVLYVDSDKEYRLPDMLKAKGPAWMDECRNHIMKTNLNFTNFNTENQPIRFFDLHQ